MTQNKFITTVKGLMQCLKIAGKVMTKSMPVPILDNFKISIKKKFMYVQSDDLETTIITKLPCEAMNDFDFTIRKDIQKFLGKCDDMPITFASTPNGDNNDIVLSTDTETVSYNNENQGSEFPTYKDFPCTANLPDSFAEITGLLNYTGDDEFRPTMMGIWLHNHNGKLRLIATNAHILKITDIGDEIMSDQKDENFTFICIPPKAAKIISDLKPKDIRIGVLYNKQDADEKSDSELQYVRLEFISSGIETAIIFMPTIGKMPDYTAVIPTEHTTELTVNKELLLKISDKAGMLANYSTGLIEFTLNGECKIAAHDNDFDKHYHSTFAGVKTGNDIEIGFDFKLLSQVVKDIAPDKGGNVCLKMSGYQRAAMAYSGNNTYLIMPKLIQG